MAKRPSVTEQARRLTEGQINRRRFIMSAVASGVTLPTATALATKAEAHTPRRGGVLRIATSGHPGDSDRFDRFFSQATGNTLLRRTSDGRFASDIAKGVEIAPDRLSVILDLPTNVQFQNGHPVDAASVVDSFSASAFDARIIDSHRVDIRATVSSWDVPSMLADPSAILRHTEYGTTGGYRIEQTDKTTVRMVRVENYWKPDAAFFDAVELHSIPDTAERHRAVMTGAMDFADTIAPAATATLKSLPSLNMLELTRDRYSTVPLQTGVPHTDATPDMSLSMMAAFSTRLSHPKTLATHMECDAYRVANRWWFSDEV